MHMFWNISKLATERGAELRDLVLKDGGLRSNELEKLIQKVAQEL